MEEGEHLAREDRPGHETPTLHWLGSITYLLRPGKVRAPELPPSTAVVTPLGAHT